MTTPDSFFPIHFSSSMFQDIWGCELKFFRKYCQKFVSGNKNHHLYAGELFASACELVRNAYFNDKISSDDAIEAGTEFILTSPDIKDETKTNERLAFVLRKYFKKFPLEDEIKPAELEDNTFAVEYYFEFDLGIEHPEIKDQNLVFSGKLDLLGERVFDGKRTELVVLDEKTCSKVSRLPGSKTIDLVKEEEVYKTRGQFIAYHWAAGAILGFGNYPTKTIVRKVPIMKEFEEAFELQIPINKFMIDCWYNSTMSKIDELKQKYLFYKENPQFLAQSSFYPVYNNECDSFARPCEYKIGCLLKEGEEILTSTHKQLVGHPEIRTGDMILSDFKKQFSLKDS